MIEETVLTPQSKPEEVSFENHLRPQTFSDYIGQDSIKKNLEILLEAAKKRKEVLDHIILYGPPGLGKTTLAHIIAKEMGVHIKVTSGPAIGKGGDLAAILTNLQPGDILFIDEIHRLPRLIEEILYPAMEDFAIDLVVGKGPSARTLRLDIPKITIIGATTRLSLLSGALRDRFGVQYHFKFYDTADISKIIERSCGVLQAPIHTEAIAEIANRCRKTPRIANRLLKRIRDYAFVKSDGTITKEMAVAALDQLEIDTHGLDRIDRDILHLIIDKFQGGPVGVGTIAAATGEEVETIEEVYEPFLIQMGFLQRTPRGRMVTPKAYEHLNLTVPGKSLF